jgi:uncharacterized protein
VAVLSFRERLGQVGHVDYHVHGILRAQPGSLDEFRGLFSLSSDPRQWQHAATTVTYRRAIRLLAEQLGCEADERTVYEAQVAAQPAEYASRLIRAARAELMFVDTGYPPADTATSVTELADLAGCEARAILRVETVADGTGGDPIEAVREAVSAARARGYVALKTIAAYRGGLDADAAPLIAALEGNEATGDPLPVQVHTGFGDDDLLLDRARPALLQPLIERFARTSFVLLHCYPFVREAAWLASVYANVYFDLSLTIPHVSRPATVLAEALELAPLSKLLYGSDAVNTPEQYLLAAVWWRDALATVLPKLLPAKLAEEAARRVLRENAIALYRVTPG